MKTYGELQDYARCFDVAILPYRRKEPTYSGSSTRFYEHLAACRPMLATRGFEELLHKEPLLRLVNTSADVVRELGDLASKNFYDGLEGARWLASKHGSWHVRALSVIQALRSRWDGNLDLPPDLEQRLQEETQSAFAELPRSGRFRLISPD